MKSVITTALAFILFACGHAYADTITFDTLPTGTIVTNQFPGVSFTGAQVLTAGSQLSIFRHSPLLAIRTLSTNFSGDTITATFHNTGKANPSARSSREILLTTEEISEGATMLGSVSTPGANEPRRRYRLPAKYPSRPFQLWHHQRSFHQQRALAANNFTLDNFSFWYPSRCSQPPDGSGTAGYCRCVRWTVFTCATIVVGTGLFEIAFPT